MKKTLLILACSMAIVFTAHSQTITWDGGGTTSNWSEAANWDLDVLPGAADDVDLDGNTVDLDVNATVQRVYAGGSSVFTVNAGITLTVTGFAGGDDGLEVQGSATLMNNGTIDISAISGAGSDGLYCKGNCTNSFSGVINTDGTGEYGIYVQGGTFMNNGTITATNFGQSNSDRDGITLDDNGGTPAMMTNNGMINITMTGGDDGIYVNDGSIFNNNAFITIGGTGGDNGIRVDDTGIFNNVGNAFLTINATPDDQLFLDLTGVFNNMANVSLNSGSDVGLYVTDAAVFTNDGDVNISGASNFSIQVDGNGSTAEIVNNGTVTITGGKDGLRLQELGSFTNNAFGILDINTPNEDGINIQATGGTVTNSGTIDISAAPKEGLDMSAGTFTNNTGALFMAYDSAEDNIEINGASIFNNGGDIRVTRTGADGSGRDDIENNSATFNNTAGATYAPGASPGELELRSGMDFGPATITFELDGTTHTTTYDRVEEVGGGTITISGATADLVWGYTPSAGDCYTIVDGNGTVSGTFASITTTNLDPAFTYTVDYSDNTEVEICVALVVPVELLSFEGELMDRGVDLKWETATEINNEGFEIERSEDGVEWKNIGFVEGNGTTNDNESYTFLDQNPMTGGNYYRLKQMDYDGAFEYSDVVFVRTSQEQTGFSAYPNPVKNELNLDLDREITNITIRLVDTAGKLIWNHTGWTQSIPFTDIEAGIYILSIEGDNFQEVKKITKN